jgi:hypothetical protein
MDRYVAAQLVARLRAAGKLPDAPAGAAVH